MARKAIDDVEMYEYLLKVDPEGTERISEQDKLEFENWLEQCSTKAVRPQPLKIIRLRDKSFTVQQ